MSDEKKYEHDDDVIAELPDQQQPRRVHKTTFSTASTIVLADGDRRLSLRRELTREEKVLAESGYEEAKALKDVKSADIVSMLR